MSTSAKPIKLEIGHHNHLYRFGNPFHTGAVVRSFDINAGSPSAALPHFTIEQKEGRIKLSMPLSRSDRVFGLGQMLGPLNKRGKRYRLFAKDDPSHTPDKGSLYGSHPFCIVQGEKTFGLFLDFPGEIIFDIGFEHKDRLEIIVPTSNFDLYLFEHWDTKLIIREYLSLTGAPYVPPRWAFGYQQCRYSYPDAETVQSVADNFRKLNIPCDALYLDIDYMQDYKVFTVDENKFPNFPKFVAGLHEQGFQVIPIIDPGVKVEHGYPTYDSGLHSKTFCVNESGEPFVGAVWPGLVHFPDFLNSNCRKWWGNQYKELVAAGISHFWNDMNEPAIFYTPESLEILRSTMTAVEQTDDLGTKAVDFISCLGNFWQNEHDLRRMYHTLDDGTQVNHYDVHNLYGYSMAAATAEGLRALRPGQRYFLVARSSYAGMHRFAVIWTGDNSSWWEHMLAQVRMVLSLNMAGFFYCGGDVGGFGGDASPELCIRWTQLGCFTPLFRNHSTKGSRQQEPWAFDEESMSIMRNFIQLRYALLPYAYSEFLTSVRDLSPYISPLFLHFGDEAVKEVEDQFMYGHSLMVAPILTQNSTQRFVRLPECRWLQWTVSSWEDRTMTVLGPGNYLLSAELNQSLLFLRENSLVPLVEPVNFVGEKEQDTLKVLGFVTSKAKFTLLHDDGVHEYSSSAVSKLSLSVEWVNGKLSVSAHREDHREARISYTNVLFEIYDESGKVHYASIGC